MMHVMRHLQKDGMSLAACKIDCLETGDDERYRRLGIPVAAGLSGHICPDHFYVANLEEIWAWALKKKADTVVLETAGLCHRCAPAVHGCLTICVIDNLVGLDTPKKIGPMLSTADIVAVTKGDVVSQAEREVFHHQVQSVNPSARIMEVNGLTGRGALRLRDEIMAAAPMETITGARLRYSMPAALCSYCAGETSVGRNYQTGAIKKIDFGEALDD
jgi:Ni2+-binding GTPase involved in maturation of urease and hydrogenase